MNHALKNKTGIMIGLICLTVLCAIPVVVFSFQGDRNVYEDRTIKRINHFFFLTNNNLFNGRWLLGIKDTINLTKEQEEKIENLMLGHEEFSIRNSAEIKIKELRFAAYLKKKKTDRKEIEAHVREISNVKTNLIVNYINYLLDVRSILTPRQLEILKQIKEQKKEKKHR